MESHRVNITISGRSPYTYYINHHVGTPKQKQTSYYTVFLDYEFQTNKVRSNHSIENLS